MPQDRPACLVSPPLKAPQCLPTDSAHLEAYGDKPPEIVPVGITDATMKTVARRLSGSAGPGGVYSISLQHWLLRFEVVSMGIRKIMGGFGDWMANIFQPRQPIGH